ncbi:PH domain-containing protein [Streptoalloteichus hindustanus]|uniref:PH domain-containing protein n=1 Tax=Streptoalloteichus hindustanus TaxID=2017 RepID=A0A1M5K641_STRHI|nr:PH domain-containing protein [Streptoalloteichus hindustanus]SHG48256.1 PH domain-containing protein [Streptoalloteichus hindustanus]
MAYPDSLLSDGELVVVHKHPHWKTLVAPVLAFLLLVGAGLYLAGLVSDLSWHVAGWIGLGALGGLLVVWLSLVPLVRWRTTHFVVTTQRVMYREGVLSRSGIDIPMSRINSVRFQHGLIDRVFGCGTLVIESASDEPIEFDDIPHVEQVHSLLYREVNDNPDDDFYPHAGHQPRRS